MTVDRAARSVLGEVKLLRAVGPAEQAPHVESTIYIGHDEPAFDGHYPGFPILPGVCLIECAHRSALLALAATGTGGTARLATIESARFLDPVFPGETVTVELTWKEVADGRQARAVVRNPRGDSARIRLRYELVDR